MSNVPFVIARQSAYVQSSSQAARRDQNRIAQREFRLRKQQRVAFSFISYHILTLTKIRDLEARVEILSGGKDEALGEMRNMLKGIHPQLMLLTHPITYRLDGREPYA